MDGELLKKYKLLAEFLGETLGSEYEVVLHNIEGENHTIEYIVNGHISGRSMGEPFTDAVFKFISDKTVLENDYIINKTGVPKNNKFIRSSTLFIKDDDGNLTGMLCINFNASKHINLAKKLLQLTHMDNASVGKENLDENNAIEGIPTSISEVTNDVLNQTLDYSDIPVERLTQKEKIEIVRELDHKGVFMLKGAVSEVAEKLEVSEATLYRYIRIVSKDK